MQRWFCRPCDRNRKRFEQWRKKESKTTGTFSLKYVNLFIKSSSLCSNVEIYLKKGYPLILEYRIGSLGKVQFVLAPINDEDENEAENLHELENLTNEDEGGNTEDSI